MRFKRKGVRQDEIRDRPFKVSCLTVSQMHQAPAFAALPEVQTVPAPFDYSTATHKNVPVLTVVAAAING
jgi:hypothetical protein